MFNELKNIALPFIRNKQEFKKLFENNISKNRKEEIFKIIVTDSIFSVKNKETKFIIDSFKYMIDIDQDLFFYFVRKKVFFRVSNYGYSNDRYLNRCIKDIYLISNDENKNYLNNITGLLKLSKDVCGKYKKIICVLSSRPYSIKTFLSLADLCFHQGYSFSEGYGLYENREVFLEAISKIFNIYKENFKFNLKNMVFIDEKIDIDYYINFIDYARMINIYNNLEINVDCLNYSVYIDSDSVSISNKEIERSLRAGYIKSDFRHLSISEIGYRKYNKSTLYNILSNINVEEFCFIDNSPERIVLKITNLDSIFLKNDLFLEEFISYEIDYLEYYCNENNLLKPLNIDYIDLVKVKRFFFIISYLYNNAAEKYYLDKKHRDKISLRNILLCLDCSKLYSMLRNILRFDDYKISVFLNLLSSDWNDTRFIDLQYQPILYHNSNYFIFPSIISESNLVRSMARKSNVNLSIYGSSDKMIDLISEAFIDKGFLIAKNISYGKEQIELDLICYKDNYIFIFECKNSYHPVNSFELVNLYEHLYKASKQIKRIEKSMNDSEFRKNILYRSKFDIEYEKINPNNIYYGIINSNRILSSMDIDEIPIVHANELASFINDGTIMLSGRKIKKWERNEFSINDLLNYLKGDVVRKDLEKILSETTYKYEFGKYKLIYKSYCLNPEHIKKLGSI